MSRFRRLLLMDEHVCPPWLVHAFDNPIRRALQDPRTILDGLVEEGHAAVDLGCGAGYFSLALAEIVGAGGSVTAVDVQARMLEKARRRAARRGLDGRIDFRLCEPRRFGLEGPVDFVLAFWMLHEVPDPKAALEEILEALQPSGRLLVVEPRVHVPARRFDATVGLARASGFEVEPGPRVWLSRSIVCSTRG